MWISKEEYNQLKSERDFYEQQLKDWEQEWKNAYKELKPIDGKDKDKTISDFVNIQIDMPEWVATHLKSGFVTDTDVYSGYMEERDWLNLVNRYDKELKSKDDEIEHFKENACNTFRSYDNLKTKYDKMQVNLDTVKHDLFMSENEVSQVREALEHEAKRNNELFKLNNRLCDKISELEYENKRLQEKLDKFPKNNFFNAYFLESEIKQLIDLLDVALRDMNLHSNCTLYELEYDSKAHIYRIVTTPKTK